MILIYPRLSFVFFRSEELYVKPYSDRGRNKNVWPGWPQKSPQWRATEVPWGGGWGQTGVRAMATACLWTTPLPAWDTGSPTPRPRGVWCTRPPPTETSPTRPPSITQCIVTKVLRIILCRSWMGWGYNSFTVMGPVDLVSLD